MDFINQATTQLNNLFRSMTLGARITVLASGLPPGLGEPVFDRLDADIAHAMMGINAV